jgi:hypothetical protein
MMRVRKRACLKKKKLNRRQGERRGVIIYLEIPLVLIYIKSQSDRKKDQKYRL